MFVVSCSILLVSLAVLRRLVRLDSFGTVAVSSASGGGGALLVSRRLVRVTGLGCSCVALLRVPRVIRLVSLDPRVFVVDGDDAAICFADLLVSFAGLDAIVS